MSNFRFLGVTAWSLAHVLSCSSIIDDKAAKSKQGGTKAGSLSASPPASDDDGGNSPAASGEEAGGTVTGVPCLGDDAVVDLCRGQLNLNLGPLVYRSHPQPKAGGQVAANMFAPVFALPTIEQVNNQWVLRTDHEAHKFTLAGVPLLATSPLSLQVLSTGSIRVYNSVTNTSMTLAKYGATYQTAEIMNDAEKTSVERDSYGRMTRLLSASGTPIAAATYSRSAIQSLQLQDVRFTFESDAKGRVVAMTRDGNPRRLEMTYMGDTALLASTNWPTTEYLWKQDAKSQRHLLVGTREPTGHGVDFNYAPLRFEVKPIGFDKPTVRYNFDVDHPSKLSTVQAIKGAAVHTVHQFRYDKNGDMTYYEGPRGITQVTRDQATSVPLTVQSGAGRVDYTYGDARFPQLPSQIRSTNNAGQSAVSLLEYDEKGELVEATTNGAVVFRQMTDGRVDVGDFVATLNPETQQPESLTVNGQTINLQWQGRQLQTVHSAMGQTTFVRAGDKLTAAEFQPANPLAPGVRYDQSQGATEASSKLTHIPPAASQNQDRTTVAEKRTQFDFGEQSWTGKTLLFTPGQDSPRTWVFAAHSNGQCSLREEMATSVLTPDCQTTEQSSGERSPLCTDVRIE